MSAEAPSITCTPIGTTRPPASSATKVQPSRARRFHSHLWGGGLKLAPMSRQKSQTISVSEPQAAVVALFVRDVAGLHVGGIPPLSPPVAAPPHRGHIDLDAARTEWSRWWEGLMAWEEERTPGPRGSEGIMPDPLQYPRLAALVEDLGIASEALAYSQDRKREAAEIRRQGPSQVLMKILTDARPSPFHRSRNLSLLVTQLPVAGEFVWRRSERHVVLSHATCADPVSYDAALRGALGRRRSL